MATPSPTGVYRPRRPERTVLYRVLSQHFERYLVLHDERFERTHGPLRPGTREAVYRYLDCGIFACGVARARCGECGHDFFVAFSCKLRCLCPSCHDKRDLWDAVQDIGREIERIKSSRWPSHDGPAGGRLRRRRSSSGLQPRKHACI